MSQKFTIAWVGETVREWAPQAAPNERNFAYEVKFEGDDRVVEWSRKASRDAPKVGEVTPPGDIKPNPPHGNKFSVNWQQAKEEGGGGSGGRSGGSYGGSGGKGSWQPEGERDPEKVARIGRAHAQEMALRYLALTGFQADPANRMVAFHQAVLPVIDAFELDVDEAAAQRTSAQKTAQGAGVAPPVNPAPPAAGSASPAPAQRQETAEELRLRREEEQEGIPFARPEYREPFSERERWSNRP